MSDRVYRASENVISSAVGEETVLLHTDTDKAFGLDATAAHIWELLQGDGKTRAQVIDAITDAYEVDRERAGGDFDTLLDHMLRDKLVTVARLVTGATT